MEESSTSYSDNYTYDIVASYIRNRVKEAEKLSLKTITEILPTKVRNLQETELLETLFSLALKIDSVTSDHVRDVMVERKTDIDAIKDLNVDCSIVKASFSDILKTWLVDDGNGASWERIIVTITLTSMMVNANIAQHGEECRTRIRDLVVCAEKFINKYMYPWISEHGDWNGITEARVEIYHSSDYDIPTTSVNSLGANEQNAICGMLVTSEKIDQYFNGDGCILPPYEPDSFQNQRIPTRIVPADASGPPTFQTPEFRSPEVASEHGSELLPHTVESTEASFHTPKEQGLNDLLRKRNNSESDIICYDIISAYLINNLTNRNTLENTIITVMPKVIQLLHSKEENMGGTALLCALIESAQIILPEVADNYHKVLKDWQDYMFAILDIKSEKNLVQKAFFDFLFAWFVRDNHPMNWDRIIMILEVLSEMVYKLCKTNGAEGFERILDLVAVADMFFQTYVTPSVSYMGGWNSVIEAKEMLRHRTMHDIPGTVVRDFSHYAKDLPDSQAIYQQHSEQPSGDTIHNIQRNSQIPDFTGEQIGVTGHTG